MMCRDIRTKAEELLNSPEATGMLDDVSAKYQPVWNVRKSVVSGYRVHLTGCIERMSSADLTLEYGLESADATNAVLDAIRYKYGSTALDNLAETGEHAVMIVPVTFSTVDRSRYVGAFLDAGSKQSQRESGDRVVFEFNDVSASMSKYRLREAVAYLRGRSRSINLCLGPDWKTANLSQYRELGVHAAGLDVDQLSMSGCRIMKVFEEFAAKCEAAGLSAFCKNIDKFSLMTAAMAAGIFYLSGSAVVPALNMPHGVAGLDLSRLLTMSKRKWMETTA